jgi:hypothetical protein
MEQNGGGVALAASQMFCTRGEPFLSDVDATCASLMSPSARRMPAACCARHGDLSSAEGKAQIDKGSGFYGEPACVPMFTRVLSPHHTGMCPSCSRFLTPVCLRHNVQTAAHSAMPDRGLKSKFHPIEFHRSKPNLIWRTTASSPGCSFLFQSSLNSNLCFGGRNVTQAGGKLRQQFRGTKGSSMMAR